MSNKTLNKFMALTKVDVAQKRIYGTFTAEVVDKSGEVADYETTKAALKAWSDDIHKVSKGKSLGNIRKMHGKEVCGKVVEINFDDVAKAVHGCVEADEKTVDEAANGILNGFSIGGSYAKKWADPVHKGKTRFTPVIAEISVVDNPCVPSAVFDFIKDAEFAVVQADGTEVMRKFAPKEIEQEQAELELDDVKKSEVAEKLATAITDTLEKMFPEKKAEAEESEEDKKKKKDKKDAEDALTSEKAADAEEMQKAMTVMSEDLKKITAERDALEKALKAIPAQIEEKFTAMTKRIKELEALPEPDKVILTTVHKGGEDERVQDKPAITYPLNGRSPSAIANILNS